MNRLLLALCLVVVACGGETAVDQPDQPDQPEEGSTMQLTSSAFTEGETIPVEHTCDGADRSPPLDIAGVPTDAAALLLVMEDPDAPGGTFDHWALADLPADTTSLPEGATGIGIPGRNSFGNVGYGGPCPPPGEEHRYVFTLRAVSERLELAEGFTKAEALEAAEGRVVAEASLTGRYGR